jgi:hypothetical protein
MQAKRKNGKALKALLKILEIKGVANVARPNNKNRL